jgi:inosine-uridine nucleoside N-ribohydrolase
MAVVLRPAIVLQSARHHVHIELGGEHTRGLTFVDWDHRSPHTAHTTIVQTIDNKEFYSMMQGALTSQIVEP